MINETDIDAFKEDFARVGEFIRRAEKGLPEDRWTTGAKGNAELAASCRRVLAYVNLQAAVMASMHEAMKEVGFEAMEPHRDPMR